MPGRPAAALVLALAVAIGPLAASASAHHRFGPRAGWRKAAEGRRSITVWAVPRLRVPVGKVIAPWNRLAGWKLLRRAALRRRADVLVRPSGTVSWTSCSPSYTRAFRRCTVWAASTPVPTLRHELGHTLGFADHVDRARWALGIHENPRLCDAPRHRAFSRYRGAMSYCDWSRTAVWFRAADRRMLARAGYLGGVARRGSGPVVSRPGVPQARAGRA